MATNNLDASEYPHESVNSSFFRGLWWGAAKNKLFAVLRTSRHASLDNLTRKPTNENGIPAVRFNDLPRDVLYTIASKLPPKEFARTSILSREWRYMWQTCPRLTFDAKTICKCFWDYTYTYKDILRFINEVNGVLCKHQNKVTETLQVKVGFVVENSHLFPAHCIDNWVYFAVSSRTKNLTLNLRPKTWSQHNDRYVFPFHLFDCLPGSTSCLQSLQLSFVSLDPPLHFKGFPNLRKLHLQISHVNGKELQHVLIHCRSLEWVHLDRCVLRDELTVATPLPCLLYLRASHCRLTKLEFNAINLVTFEYNGSFIPIHLVHSLKLQSANIRFESTFSSHALVSLLNGIPIVQNLTLSLTHGLTFVEKQWFWDNPLRFSNLRHLQLLVKLKADNILYSSASFLRATPFIEKLEIHYFGMDDWLAEVGPCREDLGQCKYKYLKNIWITGFKAARGQLEFLSHIIESADALEVLRVCIGPHEQYWRYGRPTPPYEEAKEAARTHLSAILSQNVRFDVT